MSYLSLEEQKGKDAFDNDRYYVFKVYMYISTYLHCNSTVIYIVTYVTVNHLSNFAFLFLCDCGICLFACCTCVICRCVYNNLH